MRERITWAPKVACEFQVQGEKQSKLTKGTESAGQGEDEASVVGLQQQEEEEDEDDEELDEVVEEDEEDAIERRRTRRREAAATGVAALAKRASAEGGP